jgi:spermidine synthase
MENLKSNILKICVFATGLSGIVAEYVLATLATYFIGNSVIQWALIVSIMMFSMGIGSRISRYIKSDMLMAFIGIEFLLSILVGYSALITYSTIAYSSFLPIVIYTLSIMVGLLIGMEIPLVIRMNTEFQSLRLNISAYLNMTTMAVWSAVFSFHLLGCPIWE